MAKMNQPKTDYSTRGETGEKLPKGAVSSDKSVGKKEAIKNGVSVGGEADKTGSRRGAVGRPDGHMGKHDAFVGEFNSGKSEGTHYEHERISHPQGSVDSCKSGSSN